MDGYAGFSNLVEARKDASIQLAFCWAHASYHSTSSTPRPNPNLFMLFAPLEGWRHVDVTDRHAALDYAQILKALSDRHFLADSGRRAEQAAAYLSPAQESANEGAVIPM